MKPPAPQYPPLIKPPPLTPEQIAFVLSPGNQKSLYENVRRGSFDHVQQLRDATHGSRDPAVLRVTLESLRNSRVPERIELLRKLPAAVSRSRFAVCALSVVEDQCRNCANDPKLLRVVGALIHEFWDSALTGWFKFFFVTGTHLFMFLELGPIVVMKSPVINLMSLMKAFDGSDFDLRFVPGSLPVFIQAWDCRDTDGTPIVIATDGFDDGICPVLTIFQRCTEHDETRDKLLMDMIVHDMLPLDKLVDTFLTRVRKLNKMYEEGDLESYWLVAYMYRINNVTCDIAANIMVQNALLDAGFLHLYLSTLWLVAKDPNNTLDEGGWQLLTQTMANMVKWVVHATPSILPNFMELIRGNLLAMTLKCLNIIPDDDRLFRNTVSNLELITAYSTHPPVVTLLHDVIHDVLDMPPTLILLCARSRITKKAVDGLAKAYHQNAQCVRGRWRQTGKRRFCDNLQHYSLRGTKRSGKISSTCSNCRSVLYCSQQCQKQDWIAHHRRECHLASLEYSRRKSNESWIRHVYRNYYYSLIEDLASRSRALFLSLADTAHIPIFDTSVTPYDIKTVTIADFKTEASYKFREPRMNAFIEEYQQNVRGRYLIGGIFFYGKETVHVLARVRYVPERPETNEIETDDETVDTFIFQVLGVIFHAEPVKPTEMRGQPVWSLNQSFGEYVRPYERDIPPRRGTALKWVR